MIATDEHPDPKIRREVDNALAAMAAGDFDLVSDEEADWLDRIDKEEGNTQ